MNLARIAALLAFLAGIFLAFGWYIGQSAAHAIGFIAAGLALEVLSGVPVVSRPL